MSENNRLDLAGCPGSRLAIQHALRWTIVLLVVLGLMPTGGCSRNPEVRKARFIASGDQYAAAGKRREAIIEYRNALQVDPRAVDVRAKLGAMYLQTGDASNALREYTGAADLHPGDVELQLKAADLLLLAARFDEARARAEEVLKQDPRNVRAQIIRANVFAGLKDFDSAIKEIEEAIRLDPDRGSAYASLGIFEMGRGKSDAAEAAFKKAVDLDQKSTAARMALANFYWATNQLPQAESSLKAALDIAPDNAAVVRGLATFYVATGRAAEAEPHLKQVMQLTKSPSAAFALADYYVWRRNDAAAQSILRPLAENVQSRSAATVRLAAIDHRAGRTTEAMGRLNGALSEDPGNLPALLVKTSLLLDGGDLDGALTTATTAADKHSDSTAALFALGRVQAARNQPEEAIKAYAAALKLNPRATEAKIALARLYLSRGQPGPSLAVAQDAVRTEPANPEARLVYVRALIGGRDLPAADRELQQLLAAYPNNAAVQAQRGILLGLRRDTVGARHAFGRALEIDPQSVEAFGGLVALDVAEKQTSAARARVDEWLARPNVTAPAIMLGARTYGSTGDLDTAERLLRRAIAMSPDYLAAYTALAQLYLRKGQLDAAKAELEIVATREAKPVAALTMLGMISEVQKNPAEARRHYERALEVDPEAAVAANNLAWLYSQDEQSNLDVALQLAQTASRRLPDSAEVADTLGFLYYKKQLPALAIRTLQRSVEKDPRNPSYRYHLGLAYAQAGDNERAREALKAALSKEGFSWAAEAQRALDSLPRAQD